MNKNLVWPYKGAFACTMKVVSGLVGTMTSKMSLVGIDFGMYSGRV